MIIPFLRLPQTLSFLKTFPSLKYLAILAGIGALVNMSSFPQKGQAQEQQSISVWVAANQAYREQRFLQAATSYETLLARGHINGHLYYNLGNAYFRLNDMGKAIGYYLLAFQYLPRHEDLIANLNYARMQTIDRRENPGSSWREVFRQWSSPMTLQEWFLLLVIASGIFWGGALVRLFYRREILSWLVILSGGLTLFLFVGLFIKWWAPLPTATILPQESVVFSAPHRQSTVLFRLHAGTEVTIEEEMEQWIKIRFEPTQKGWVERNSLFLVYPPGT